MKKRLGMAQKLDRIHLLHYKQITTYFYFDQIQLNWRPAVQGILGPTESFICFEPLIEFQRSGTVSMIW